MSGEAEFPRSPIRDYDPFGKRTGANPFAEAGNSNVSDSGAENGNLFAASSTLADPAPQVEYEAVLTPRIIVITATLSMGFCFAFIATALLIFFPPGEGLAAHAILFPIGLALFMGGVMTSQLDLRAMKQGAMKRDQVSLVRQLNWGGWLGSLYCLALEVLCVWSVIEKLFHQAFG